jgi:uncharacterized protein YbjT (DUF2867 family)
MNRTSVRVRTESEVSPLADAAVARVAADTVRKACAVGLADESPDFSSLTYPAVKRVVARVRAAGIGELAAASLARTDPADVAAIARDLRQIESLLEQSPVPDTEWPRTLQLFDRDRLAPLLGISPSSAVRYAGGERVTPDAVAARLHFIALVASDLAGAYNAIGIRRWFDRPRAALGGRAPADLLTGDWAPDDEGPVRVRELARSVVESPAT